MYYTNKGTTVNTPDGTQVVVGASAPVKVANSKTDDYRTVSADRDEVQQFCEKYFSDLSVNNNGSDDFGRPSEQWKNGSKAVSYTHLLLLSMYSGGQGRVDQQAASDMKKR